MYFYVDQIHTDPDCSLYQGLEIQLRAEVWVGWSAF